MIFIGLVILVVLSMSALTLSEEKTSADKQWKTYELKVRDQILKIPYNIANGQVMKIEFDEDSASMNVLIESDPAIDGMIEIIIPREIFGYEEQDIYFEVEGDGNRLSYDYSSSAPCFDGLEIEFTKDTKVIQISAISDSEVISTPLIFVATDNDGYERGDVITVYGCVSLALSDNEVVLEIINPEGRTYRTLSAVPDVKGWYLTSFTIDDPLAMSGKYRVRANYGGQSGTSDTFVFRHPYIAEDSWKIIEIKLEGQIFKIPYKMTDGILQGIEVDPDFTSIIAAIESYDDGTIEITMPRNLLDARTEGGYGDDEFIVLVDGEEETYEEVNKSPCFRTLLIPVPGGTEEIEIIAGYVLSGVVVQQMNAVPPIFFTTEKVVDYRGEEIIVSGCTNLALNDKEVLLEVLDSEGNVYRTISVTPNRNGTFSALLTLGSESAPSDKYSVQATYAGYTVIPEFPANLMNIVAIGLIAALIAFRLNMGRQIKEFSK